MPYLKTCKTCMNCDPYCKKGSKIKCLGIRYGYEHPMVNIYKDRSNCHSYKKRYDPI